MIKDEDAVFQEEARGVLLKALLACDGGAAVEAHLKLQVVPMLVRSARLTVVRLSAIAWRTRAAWAERVSMLGPPGVYLLAAEVIKFAAITEEHVVRLEAALALLVNGDQEAADREFDAVEAEQEMGKRLMEETDRQIAISQNVEMRN